MLQLWWRRLSVVCLFLIVAACSGGGGCSSGCAGCGATPLPGGFPKGSVVQNAAGARLTRHGLDFLGDNLGSIAGSVLGGANKGVINFAIPKISQSITITTLTVCDKPAAGECVADINIAGAKLHLDSANYSNVKNEPAIRISGTIPVKVDSLPIDLGWLGSAKVGVGNGGCNGGTPKMTYADVPVDVYLPLISETIAPRDGYTKVDTANAVINANLDKNYVAICGGFTATVLSAVKGTIVNQLNGQLGSTLKSTLESQLCTKPDPTSNPPCPTGTQPDGGNSKCVYKSDPSKCVPIQLGTDGHLDLSGALASISPGTSGGLDFMLASGGNMLPTTAPAQTASPDGQGHTANGLTLGMMGGALPMPQSNCVPIFANPIPQGIPIPDELASNSITPWAQGDKGPDLGIALSGRFLNYAFGGIYNSGLLCLGVSTEQFAQLQSGLLSVLIPGMKTLTFEQKAAPVAIVTRPQQAPIVTLGSGKDIKTDPLLTITLKSFAIDFYVWNLDRFVRAFTFTGDISIPINITTAIDPKTNPAGGLLPVLGGINIAPGAKVTNNDLLTDNPDLIAGSLASLLGGIAGQFLGAIKPIDLSAQLSKFGIALTIPDGGIRKLTKDKDDFLGIFGDLALPNGNAVVQADVQARLVGKTVHAEAMGLATADRTKLPALHVMLSSALDNGAHRVEYSYVIDQGTRSAWAEGRDVTIQNDALFLQGKHLLHVFAREVGVPASESTQPADVPFAIDVLAPVMQLAPVGDDVEVRAWDIVSQSGALVARHRTTDGSGDAGAWSQWAPVATLTHAQLGSASSVAVEVKDEEGNVTSEQLPLVRGRPDPTSGASGGGCGCSVPRGDTNTGWLFAVPSLAGIAAFGWRRRSSRRDARTKAVK